MYILNIFGYLGYGSKQVRLINLLNIIFFHEMGSYFLKYVNKNEKKSMKIKDIILLNDFKFIADFIK